jgi:hypothetical protein
MAMRHLGSFALALVLAPAVFLLTGVGLDAFAAASAKGPQSAPVDTALALAALAVAAGVYAVLIMARLSPIGPMMAGLAFLGVSAWPMVDNPGYKVALSDFMGLFSDSVEIRGFNLVGLSGLGVFLAIPLLATVASPRRWTRYDYPVAAVEPRYAPVDSTRYLPTQSGDAMTAALPDVPAPSLGYPKSATPVTPPSAQPVSAPPVPPPAAPEQPHSLLGGSSDDATVALPGDDPDKTKPL